MVSGSILIVSVGPEEKELFAIRPARIVADTFFCVGTVPRDPGCSYDCYFFKADYYTECSENVLVSAGF